MNVDFNRVLEQLAKAFNTSVEYLYPILIKQAYVAGIQSILIFLVPPIVIYIIYKLAIKSKESYDKYGCWEWDDEGFPFLIAIAIIAFVGIFTTFEMIDTAPTAFLNPEYWAIKEVLEAVNLD